MKGRTMSDNYNDDDESNEDETSIPSLRRAAGRSKKLEAELNSTKRELAFSRAGIQLDDPRMKYFVKGYEGELDSDSIKSAAVESGFLVVQNSSEPETPLNIEGQNRVMAASAGSVSEDVSEEAAISRMQSAMNEGGMDAFLDVVRQYGMPTHIDQ
jgi:ribosomal protein L12E/L44/L45/RPP1/RPP2